jgi:asparagine synthase (glutamine-hydrolysing)
MCRIAGIYDPRSRTLAADIRRMTDAMRHGGPDDEGMFLDPAGPLALGHRRLALIDLSPGGHQPMVDADGALQIIFNGEIYNYRELRETLRGAGWQFATTSDTEVILKAYQQWGPECFESFNGMFALAIFDRNHNHVVLARDHAGIKPLYYYLANDQLYFASEIRAFHAVEKRFSENSAWKIPFLAFGHLPEPVTTLQGVQPLRKGHCMIVQLPGLTVVSKPFCQFRFSSELHDAREASHLVRSALDKAVERHLISDAPIGVFLSGGIDSSSLSLLAKPFVGDRLKTLSITFQEAEFSEKKYQEMIARKLGGKHFDFEVSRQEFSERMPDALRAMDQPTTDAINSYFISLYARQVGLKAALAGPGADELFGGYPTFHYGRYYRTGSRLPSSLLRLLEFAPDDRLRKLSYVARKSPVGECLAYRGLFSVRRIAALLGGTEQEVQAGLDQITAPAFVRDLDDGNRVSWLETNFYLQNQLLKDADFMSMWHGLEIRVPFLDRELMALVHRIDSSVKFGRTFSKQLLIDAMGADLPEPIWNRKKQGFTFPFEKWMRDSEITAPDTREERTLFAEFKSGRLAWGRYWCALLANRFREFVPNAAS